MRRSPKARSVRRAFENGGRHRDGEARHEPASTGVARLDDIADGEPTEDTLRTREDYAVMWRFCSNSTSQKTRNSWPGSRRSTSGVRDRGLRRPGLPVQS
jgi:hypothetical protein